MNLKRRPVFDSSKSRIAGTGVEQFQKQNGSKLLDKHTPNSTRRKTAKHTSLGDETVIPTLKVQSGDQKKSNWRTKHEQFIRNIRMAKGHQGGSLSDYPPPPADDNPDYVTCHYCNRRFNEQAAERHIPFCKKQIEKDRLHPSPVKIKKQEDAKSEALRRRTLFQPPPPKVKKSPQSPVRHGMKGGTITMAAPPPISTCCNDCGGHFATDRAKFCFECGAKR